MAGNRTLKLSILGDVDGLNKSLKAATKDAETFGDKMGKIGKVVGAALAAATVAAGAFAIKIGVEAVKAASDLSETISKVGVLFGDTSKEIEKFADGAASSLGQTKQQALDAAATFATFGKAAGLSGQDLSKFSIDFVKLSSDLASFNNTSPEQAINAIGSALRGEAEPLRAYGVLLDDASLRQAALELGIISTTKNALTPQQKVLAAQALIYKQTGAAQGDFERTSDGLANKTRILTAQLENAKTTIGTALLPIVTELATVFSETVIPIVEKFSEAFSNSEGNLGGVVTNVGNILKNTFTPIINGVKSAFDSIKSAVVANKDELNAFFAVVKYVAPLIGTAIGGAITVVGKIAETVLTIISKVLAAIKPLLNTAINGINLIIKGYNAIQFGTDIPSIPKVGATTGSAGAGGFSGVTPGGTAFGSGSIATLPKVTGSGTAIPGGLTTGITGGDSSGSGVAAVAASAAAVAATAATTTVAKKITESIAASITDQVSGLGDVAGFRFFEETGGQITLATPPSFNPAGFRRGEEADRVNTVNLTVNGAIDPEGTARTIINTLNNSFYRGTGGATNLQIA